MRRFLLTALALTLTSLAVPAAAQSWCSAAGLTPTEATICADSGLRRLDRQLADVYGQTDGAVNGQRAWLDWRNACGSDAVCIENRYRIRIASLQGSAPPEPVAGTLRPWCRNDPLNPAERTICATPRLADLDAAMAAIYGATGARPGESGQQSWLQHRRDTCGRDRSCLKDAYVNRIIELGAELRGG